MALTTEDKAGLIKGAQLADGDTGSTEVQVSLLTSRIHYLTDHFKQFKKDLHSRRGLEQLVSRRRKLLKYLKRKSLTRYRDLIQRLKLRDTY